MAISAAATKRKMQGESTPNAGNPTKAAAANQKRLDKDAAKVLRDAEREQKKRDKEAAKAEKLRLKAEKELAKSNKALSVATGVILAKAITKMVANSKILSTVFGTLNKLLGLLVDVILLPFLPLIMGGLLFLAEAIMGFSDWWQANFGNPDTTDTTPAGGGITKGDVNKGKQLAIDTFGVFFGIDLPTILGLSGGAIAGAIIGGLVGSLLGPQGAILGAMVGAAVVGILGVGITNEAYKLGAIVGQTLSYAYYRGYYFMQWLQDRWKEFGDWIGPYWAGIEQGFTDAINTIGGFANWIIATFNGIMASIKNAIINGWNNIVGSLPGGEGLKIKNTPSYDTHGNLTTSSGGGSNTTNNNSTVNLVTGTPDWFAGMSQKQVEIYIANGG